MAKFDKNSLASRVKSSSQGIGADIASRLDRAQELVKRQPTGFSEPRDAPSVPDSKTTAPAFTRESAGNGVRPVYFAAIPIDNIDPNPFNARQIYRPEQVKEIATSMLASGQLIPGLATVREGRTVLAAGHYRWKGIKAANIPFMNLMIHEGLTDQELYEISYKENDERTAQSPLDNALSWKKLIDDKIYASESAIAEATGMSLPNINKTLAILRLSEPVLELIRQQPEHYALSALYELVQLEKSAGTEVAVEIAKKIGNDEAGRKEVSELRARYEDPKIRKQKENSRQYKIHVDGQPAGFIKEWDSGRVVFEVTLGDQGAREALVQDLKARFNLADPAK
jgi:ParB family chromosome partitioning protein